MHLPGTHAQYLEWREKQYDVREYVDVFVRDETIPAVKRALVYIASPNTAANVNWLGPAPLEAIAAQIATSHGPSGPNCDYLYNLATAMAKVNILALIGVVFSI